MIRNHPHRVTPGPGRLPTPGVGNRPGGVESGSMRSIKALVSVALGLAFCAGTAAASAPIWDPDAAGSGPILSVSITKDARAAPRSTGGEAALQVEQEKPKRAKGKAPANFSATVPVYFHVVTDGRTGSLTNSQIALRSASSTTPSPVARAARTRGSHSCWQE